MEKIKLTKAEMIDNILATNSDLSEDYVREVIDKFFEEIKKGLEEGKVIELRGLGTFELRERKGRPEAINPKTGEPVSTDDHMVACFRPGKDLQQRVRTCLYKDDN